VTQSGQSKTCRWVRTLVDDQVICLSPEVDVADASQQEPRHRVLSCSVRMITQRRAFRCPWARQHAGQRESGLAPPCA